jgi:LysM repeat protein
VLALVMIIALLSGCGGLEWSSDGQHNRSKTISTSTFTNATAVIVGPGDTVYALSRRHGVSQRDIIIANKLVAPYKLNVGQRIVLPRGKVYTVVSGDTLGKIASKYNVNVYDLARTNNIHSPYTIYIDQELQIPGTGTVTASNTSTQNTSATSTTTSNTTQTQTLANQVTEKTLVPPPPPTSGYGFIWPTEGKILSSFGAKEGGLFNDGINRVRK